MGNDFLEVIVPVESKLGILVALLPPRNGSRIVFLNHKIMVDKFLAICIPKFARILSALMLSG